jgi:hypothetical protein
MSQLTSTFPGVAVRDLPGLFRSLGALVLFCATSVLAGYTTATAQQAPIRGQQEAAFFYSKDQRVDVMIQLDRIAVAISEQARPDSVRAFLESLGLGAIEEYRAGIRFIRLRQARDRAALTALARDIRSRARGVFAAPQLVVNAGLVIVPAGSKDPTVLTDQFIARFNDGVTRSQIDSLNQQNGVTIVGENPFVANQFLLTVSAASGADALAMANRYYAHALTAYAYPNFMGALIDMELPTDTGVTLQPVIPNDPLFGNQWHLHNTGQSGGTVDADPDLPEAWDFTVGAATTVIAVLENGGFDVAHPDLTPNLWVNPGEDLNANGTIEAGEINGTDDDGNGFIDDFNGWDFGGCAAAGLPCGDNNPAPADATENHGTAVAGVAGARGNNALGVSGSCPSCRIMLLRTGYTSDWAKSLAFGYAQQMGAQLVTNSWGGGGTLPNTGTAIDNATTAGLVVLFAAGNTTADVCATPDPRVAKPNVFAVSSSSNQDRKVVFAATGICVDILTPSHRGYATTDPYVGTLNVTTTDRTGTNGYNNVSLVGNCPTAEATPPPANARDYTNCFGGTSSATPLTAGVVALLETVNPGLNRVQLQQLIQNTADKIEPGAASYADAVGFSTPAAGATHSWGRLNAFEAVRIVAPVAGGGKNGRDAFLRDNRLDWGNTQQTSNTTFEATRGFIGHWRSMDIKVDAPPYQTAPTATTFDAFVDETPSAAAGEVNRVYVRVRNRGTSTVASTTVKLHWTQFGTALPALPADFWAAFPANSTDPTNEWTALACEAGGFTCTVTNLVTSGSTVAGCPGRTQPACAFDVNGDGDTSDPGDVLTDNAQIVRFNFPAPPIDPTKANHFCLLAMIDSPEDRVLPLSRPTQASDFVPDWLTPHDNNVTHRNYQNLSTTASDSFSPRFYVRNPLGEAIRARLEILKPETWRVVLDSFAFGQEFRLAPGQEILLTVHVAAPARGAETEITITQQRTDVTPVSPMGGLTFGFRDAGQSGPIVRGLSLHAGAALPFGTLANTTDRGPSATLDYVFPITPMVAADLRLGYSLFNGTGAAADVDIWNLSANIKVVPALTAPWVFVNGGLGLYYVDTSDLAGGFNTGIGVGQHLGSHLDLEATFNYHRTVTASPNLAFGTLQLGLIWSF